MPLKIFKRISHYRQVTLKLYNCYIFKGCPNIIFTESALWAGSVIESTCLSVCLSDVKSNAYFFRPLIGPQITWPVQGLSLDRPSWTIPCGSATRGALKTRGSSGLDSWTIPEDWTRGPSLVDRPSWTAPHGSAPRGALKTGRCSKLDRKVLFSLLTQCYYPYTLRESVSPVCGILV